MREIKNNVCVVTSCFASCMSQFTNGDIYNGKYMKDSKNGEGQYKYKAGNAYSGSWKKGLFDGWGEYMDLASETIYDG